MSDVLNVEKRDLLGSANARRLRRAGKVPAILYGHGKGVESLAVSSDEINAILRHGARLVELKGAAADTAFVKDVQMDALGSTILHIDFTRISAGETVEVTVSIELRGNAPGEKQGGSVEHSLHQVQIRCPATAIPEKLEVSVNSLGLNESITAGDLKLPEGAELLVDASQTIVSCNEADAQADTDEVAAPTDGAEPEVIGRKEDDAEEG